jgi:hypothetical protein
VTTREAEYRALRDTIRERGSIRIWVAVCGVTAWGALTVATMALLPWPVATILPLLVLAASFEAVFALHTGVERVGRYVQVFHESDNGAEWERVAMAFGERFPGSGPDPLFGSVYAAATIFNFVPAIVAGALPVEYVTIGTIHALFLVRLALARRQAAGQRARDLDRFQQLRDARRG